MHVVMVIAGGFGLLALFCLFGWLWGASSPAIATAAFAFMPVWLVIAIVNMWIGVTRAGYTVAEELPILVLVALVPIAVAGLIVWQLRG